MGIDESPKSEAWANPSSSIRTFAFRGTYRLIGKFPSNAKPTPFKPLCNIWHAWRQLIPNNNRKVQFTGTNEAIYHARDLLYPYRN